MTAEQRALMDRCANEKGDVYGEVQPALQALLAAHDRYEKALRVIQAVTNPNGPDKASAQYMADTAHKIAQEALCESSTL